MRVFVLGLVALSLVGPLMFLSTLLVSGTNNNHLGGESDVVALTMEKIAMRFVVPTAFCLAVIFAKAVLQFFVGLLIAV